jgi:hypothetical protein
MVKKYHVTLTPEERVELEAMVATGKSAARKVTHARVLLKADEAEGGPGWSDASIADARWTSGSRPWPACGSGSWRRASTRHWCHAPRPACTPAGWTGTTRRGW